MDRIAKTRLDILVLGIEGLYLRRVGAGVWLGMGGGSL